MTNKSVFDIKSFRWLWVLLLTLALLPFPFLAFHASPALDDYSGYEVLNIFKAENYVSWMYQNWSGRFIGSGLVYLNPVTYGAYHLYWLIPMLGMILLIFSIRTLISTWFKRILSIGDLWLTSGILFVFYIYLTPSVATAFFWATGVIYYTIPFSFALFSIAFFPGKDEPLSSKIRKGIFSITLGFLAAGANEIIGMLLIEILIINTLIRWKGYHKKPGIFEAFYIAIVAMALLIIAFAPGNAARLPLYPDTFNLVKGIFIPIAFTVLLSGWILMHPAFLISLILLIVLFPYQANWWQNHPLRKIKSVWIWLIVLLVPLTMFVPVCFMLGTLPPWRLINLATILLATGFCFAIIHSVSALMKNRNDSCPNVSLLIKKTLIAAVIFFLFFDAGISSSKLRFSFRSNISRAWVDWVVLTLQPSTSEKVVKFLNGKEHQEFVPETIWSGDKTQQQGHLDFDVPQKPYQP